MERGKEDKIVITRNKVSRQPEVVVEGLWSGKDRNRISRMLLRAMRSAAHQERQTRKQADLIAELEKKRLAGLAKARAAKKKKNLEEEKENVRGQSKSSK